MKHILTVGLSTPLVLLKSEDFFFFWPKLISTSKNYPKCKVFNRTILGESSKSVGEELCSFLSALHLVEKHKVNLTMTNLSQL